MRSRLLIAAGGIVLFAAGVVGWVFGDTQASFYSDRVDAGALPLWASLFLIFGPVLFASAVAIPENRSLLRWSAPLLFILWLFQAAGLLSVYLAPAPHITYFDLARESSISLGWWALVALAFVVIAIAVATRWTEVSPIEAETGEPDGDPSAGDPAGE